MTFVLSGGGEHTDLYGIHYRADPQRVGVASDFGSRLIIARTHAHDSILYQTERYHNDHFSYEVHLPVDDADYVIVLKFCEVYFQAPNEKVNRTSAMVGHLFIYSFCRYSVYC